MSTADRTETPIYVETLIEAKRRTKRHSPERKDLALMDERTRPRPMILLDPATVETLETPR